MKQIKLLLLFIVMSMIVPQTSYAQKKRSQSKSKASAAKVSEPRKQSASIENLDNMTAEQLWQKFCVLANENKFAESVKYLKKAAEKKHLESMFFLAEGYLDHGGILLTVPKQRTPDTTIDFEPSKLELEKDERLGLEYLKAASELGHGGAMIDYGNYLLGKGDNDEAFRWFTKATATDNKCLASCQLAKCYLNGWGCEKNEQLGIKMLEESAECAGRYEYWIYWHYLDEKQYAKAAPWLHIAAEKGDDEAMFQLSYLYAFGLGVPKNEKTAFDIAWRSAEKGYSGGVMMLGTYYMDGIGVEKNKELAIKYFEKALKMDLNEETIGVVKQFLEELKNK